MSKYKGRISDTAFVLINPCKNSMVLSIATVCFCIFNKHRFSPKYSSHAFSIPVVVFPLFVQAQTVVTQISRAETDLALLGKKQDSLLKKIEDLKFPENS